MNKQLIIIFIFFLSIIQFSCTEREIPVLEDTKSRGYSEIKGKISGTLTKANSPYLVTENIFIDSSASLLVEPGTDIHFEDGTGLMVLGNILLLGTREEPIILSTKSDSWRGITIENSGTSEIQFCIIENTDNTDSSFSSKTAVLINSSTVTVSNCIFRNNSAQYGGALHIDNSTVDLYNNIFRDNYAAYYGGAVYSSNSNLTAINNTFFKNVTDNFGGGIVLFGSPSVVQNNIFSRNTNRTGNTGIAFGVSDTSIEASFNFFSTPEMDAGFVSDDDLHLDIGSPCINAGNPDPAYNDSDGTRNNQGAYGGPLGDW